MSVITIPKALRDKLGDEGTDAFIKVINDASFETRRDLTTKEDLFKVESRLKDEITKLKDEVLKVESKLKDEIATIKSELLLLKWMMGILIAGVVSLVMKAFFM
ncbi:MAG: hypothetical protein SFH39_00730 [Candidatus Magnetobacterium sp. LHC-1]